MNNTRPSFYLISSAVDGNVNAIEKILALYDPYISKCCLRPFYDRYGAERGINTFHVITERGCIDYEQY